MSKLADTATRKWQHECTSKGKTVTRQIIDYPFCRVCGWEHEE